MKLLRACLLPLALLVATGAAQAQKMAPGLWENTVTMKSGDGQMEAAMAKAKESMAKMPPEQRKMMEEMMAKQGVGMAPGQPNVIRSCISKEQAEKGEPPESDKEGRCKREGLQRSGSTVKFKLVCTNPPSTGEAEFTMASDKAYSGRFTMNTEIKGKPQQMEMQQQGKWIGADCGTLKPRQ